ncbi:hypothetical protein B0F90DRAFT_306206 [Multifurca ochricompacta]|uniref:AMP-activated protein kinase glycogen-binding domain-containing protein n=1 Tax=Multifurca ochricompacta TaxID=376703 RepID=A0AAD4LW79_9AGAM|nr:hypothetical protein B0F90DRAFT_306206 [Multifurca ochricompacta]
MSSQDLHQVILRWPHADANEVIVTGTFDQWSSSLRLTRKPDGFEAPPIFIPWKDKFAYKFIVDGRWMTNDAEPTEIDHGFVNNVYTAPQKPALQEPIHATAPPSYHSESEAEPEPAEKAQEHAEEPVANGSAHGASHEPPAHEQVPTLIEEEEVKAAVEPVVEAAQAAVAQVAPSPQEVEKAAYELTPEPQALKEAPTRPATEPVQIPILELAPDVPIGILPNSTPSGATLRVPLTPLIPLF